MPRTPDIPSTQPTRWRGLLSPADWRRGVEAVGPDRLDELLPLLEQVSADFRVRFLDELVALAPGRPAGRAVLLALARACDAAAGGPR